MDDIAASSVRVEQSGQTSSLDLANHTLLEIVDVELLRRVIKQFSRMHGIAVGLVDHETQDLLLSSGFTEICRNFNRVDESACQICIKSNKKLTAALADHAEINIDHCDHGLVDGATPVIVAGKHVADLYIGQVLFQEPDIEFFKENARRFGFDEEQYLAALNKVQVVDEKRFTAMLKYIADLAGMIGEMGVSYLKVKRKEEQHLRLIERTQEAISVVRDGVLLYVNPAYCRMLGYSTPNQLVGKDRFAFVNEEYRSRVKGNYDKRMQGGDAEASYEIGLNHRDGHLVWVEVQAEVIDFDGQPAVLAALHDITKRKQAELDRRDLIEKLNAVNEELGATNEELNATNEELIATNEELADTIAELNKANKELNSTYEELNSTYEELHSTYEELARTEEEIRISEEYHRALISNAADGVAIIDTEATLKYESHPDGKLLGYMDSEMIGTSVMDKVHPADVERVAASLDEVIREPGAIRDIEVRFRHKQGHWVVLDTTCQNLCNHPRIQGIVINYRDITARKEAENRLRASEDRYRKLVDNMSEGMVAVDREERLIFANPAAEDLFGFSNGDLLGRNLSEFTDASTYAMIVKETQERSFGKSSEYEIGIRRADETERTVLVNAVPMHDDAGEITGSFGLLRDITERKLADMKLRDSVEQFRALVENSPDIIVRYDRSMRIDYVNPVVTEITGEDPAEMIGKTYAQLGYAPEQFEAWESKIRTVFDTGKPVKAEIKAGRDNRLFEWRLNPVFQGNGEVQSVLGTLTDITDRKKLTERLVREQKEESMLTLSGGIAHDFNNILIGVLGSASILHDTFGANEYGIEDQSLYEDGMALCSTIITSSKRMSDLTNKLLSYARGGSLKTQSVDLRETITDTLAMVRGRIPSNMKIQQDIDTDLWPVEGDPGQLHQVWLNLIINAEEAMPVGGELRITAVNREMPGEWTCPLGHQHPPGNYVHATVEDEGEGMDADTLKRVFEPFFSTKFQGRGLGLAAVNGIVLTHGGCIHATSKVGVGSTFHVYLLCADKPVAKHDPEELAVARPGETVLVVDDEEIVRLTARRMLKRRGFEVLTVSNATDGLQMMCNRMNEIDLVMFDMHMPRISGLEFFRALRQLNKEVRAVAISGYNEAVALQDLDKSKLDAFIQKPFSYKSLVSKVREVLDREPRS